MSQSDPALPGTAAPPDPAQAFSQYFCCPREFAPFRVAAKPSLEEGFFRFGSAVCYGKLLAGQTARTPLVNLVDAQASARIENGQVSLDFNPSEVIDNLRLERYFKVESGEIFFHSVYYS